MAPILVARNKSSGANAGLARFDGDLYRSVRCAAPRARGLAVMTSLSHSEGHRFESGRAHPFLRSHGSRPHRGRRRSKRSRRHPGPKHIYPPRIRELNEASELESVGAPRVHCVGCRVRGPRMPVLPKPGELHVGGWPRGIRGASHRGASQELSRRVGPGASALVWPHRLEDSPASTKDLEHAKANVIIVM